MRLVSTKPIGRIRFVWACAWRLVIALWLTMGLPWVLLPLVPFCRDGGTPNPCGWAVLGVMFQAREYYVWPTLLYVLTVSLFWSNYRRLRTIGLKGAYVVAVPILMTANFHYFRSFASLEFHGWVWLFEHHGLSALLSAKQFFVAALVIAFLAIAKPAEDQNIQSLQERFGMPGQIALIAIATACAVALYHLGWAGLRGIAAYADWTLVFVPLQFRWAIHYVNNVALAVSAVSLLVLIVQALRPRRAMSQGPTAR